MSVDLLFLLAFLHSAGTDFQAVGFVSKAGEQQHVVASSAAGHQRSLSRGGLAAIGECGGGAEEALLSAQSVVECWVRESSVPG